MSRAPAYTPEEDAAILAGPEGESAELLKGRVEALGFPERAEGSRKQRKAVLRRQDGTSPRATVYRGVNSKAMLRRRQELLNEEQRLVTKLEHVRTDLDNLIKEMAVLAITYEGVDDELVDAFRAAITADVAVRRGQ